MTIRWLTVRQAAEMLGRTYNQTDHLISLGKIPAASSTFRFRRVREDHVQDFLKAEPAALVAPEEEQC